MEISFDKLPQAVSEIYEKLVSIERLILQSKSEVVETDELFNIQQAAEFLNLRVPTIYSLVSKSAIPNSKKGKRLYFSKLELLDWIKTGRNKTHEELDREAEQMTKRK